MKSQAGFSLIELMVVVAIIGILSTVAIPNYEVFKGRALNGRRIAEMSSTVTYVKSMIVDDDYGHAPLPEGSTWFVGASEPGDGWGGSNAPNWIPGLPDAPRDPVGGTTDICEAVYKKSYEYLSDGKEWKIINHCGSAFYSSQIDPRRGGDCPGSGQPAWAIAFWSSDVSRCW